VLASIFGPDLHQQLAFWVTHAKRDNLMILTLLISISNPPAPSRTKIMAGRKYK
jgi:hypothetical protein